MTTPANPAPASGNPSPQANAEAAAAAGASAEGTGSRPELDPAAPAAAAASPVAISALEQQMLADRFDAVAARAGIDEVYTEVALELFRKTGQEPTKANLTKFCGELKKTRPALFGPQPAQTAPVPAGSAPTAPAPGAASSPYQQWQALRAAGRRAEAEAFYAKHRRAITRTAG